MMEMVAPWPRDYPADNTMFSRRDGSLFLEGLRLQRLLAPAAPGIATPFYIYSRAQLERNFALHREAVLGLDALVGFAVKANHNLEILRIFQQLGAGAVVVSQVELHHAIRAGFDPARILLHGNGKTRGDLEAALRADVLISADSAFDLRHIEETAAALAHGRRARVLLRVNPDIDAQVHPYISTGLLDSKFGIPEAAIEELRGELAAFRHLAVHGVHCHLGSTLKSVRPFVDGARLALALAARLRAAGHPVDTIDLGGGLGIDYSRKGEDIPTPKEMLDAIRPELAAAGLKVFLEPGRSLVGNAGALVGRVLGVKHNPQKSFLVTDASMTQLIRPSLYGAYHHIELLETPPGAARRYDVVGPICESADFLGKDRPLPPPREGDGVIVYDAGAYGFSMASRYNLNLLCAEYLVRGEELVLVRRAESYEDFARTFACDKVELP